MPDVKLDAFDTIKCIFGAWKQVSEEAAKKVEWPPRNDDLYDAHQENYNRLFDSNTMLAFGYVSRAKGEFILQSDIVNALADGDPKELQRLRQDIKRRSDALAYFNFISRKKSGKRVEFSMKEEGSEYLKMFNERFNAEYTKITNEGENND
ncbi:hypothetical protein LJR030_003640 [Rhizobium sp. LjRoot30]|uniref:hypothetical protein n=1 Tax=Rhizobium sp. LjRoot30 TaxID=3342320 RepID=UPI003ECE85B2